VRTQLFVNFTSLESGVLYKVSQYRLHIIARFSKF